jgi:RHS repeat-associated protein
MSKPFSAATGFYNYGFRDYKPQAARFTTVDPIRDGNNWFIYVNNDPVNYIDLWGLCAEPVRENIPARVFIVEETGWQEEVVRQYMENITTIFHKHNVIFNLDITITNIPSSEDLRNFYPIAYTQYHHIGYRNLLDTSAKAFIYIFTERINSYFADFGVYVQGTTTVAIAYGANNSTPAHETGHIMGLGDTHKYGGNNLMDWGRPIDINEIYLTPEQIQIANNYLLNFPHPFEIR